MAGGWRGVFTIPVTPFDERGGLDEASLRRQVDWCVRAGAHGIVAPVNASEGPSLTDEERRIVTRIVVEETAGRIPTVIGVSGTGVQSSLLFTRWAREVGADAVIAMPPYGARLADPEAIFGFYQAVADAAGDLPVFIQNWSGPAGTPMGAPLVVRLLKEIPNVLYSKEETASAGHLMTATLEGAGDACLGVMGGIGGRYLLDEYRRGACGTMPAGQVTDVHAQVWNALDAGEHERARALFNRLLPLLNLEALFGVAMYKEVLKRRGVIAHTTIRGLKTSALDAYDRQELDAIWADVSGLFTI
jgi:dihydrodipicolinate synthase/N-acetylneuraminate lyase